ncbi:MAG: hypothetical protein V8K32_08395 [Candidatus Electrothrix gigas]
MNVYAETNFVLEMALRQEQGRDCEAIAALCRGRCRMLSRFDHGYQFIVNKL